MQNINLEPRSAKIDSLKPHPNNPNKGQVEVIEDSIAANGWFGRVIVQQSTGHILAGEHRWRAAQAKGATHIDIQPVDCDDETAKRILLVDNRTAALASRNPEALAGLLRDLKAAEGLDGTGYDDNFLDNLLGELEDKNPEVTEQAPEAKVSQAAELQKKWSTASGQLWIIGPHRLLCGDATDPEVAARLFGEDLADGCWTDPPYGIEYEGRGKDKLTIQNDGADGLYDLLRGAFANILNHTKPGGAVYVAHPSGVQARDFYQAWLDAGLKLHQGLVWVKQTLVLGRCDYHPRFEPILYGYIPTEKGTGRRGRFGGDYGWYGDDSQSSVLEFDRPNANDLHPTMKPPELVAYCLRNSIPFEGLVYEPFGGSGTTMVAAQQTGRRCYSTELDPAYCAVILERLSEMGLEPVLET